jgi:hypothetical protein
VARPRAKPGPPEEGAKPFDFWKRLKEIDRFFEGRGREHKTMRRVAKKLEKAKIPYAIIGGMAVNAHRHERTTKDVDILLTPEGLAKFRQAFVPKDYEPVARRPRRFFDRTHQVHIDFLITGLFPRSGKPGPIAFPDPAAVSETIENLQVVKLTTLIELKLAARRHYDFGDVVHLIRVHQLDEAFLARLHPSVHTDFIECLVEKRREDEYEARQDQAFEELQQGEGDDRGEE